MGIPNIGVWHCLKVLRLAWMFLHFWIKSLHLLSSDLLILRSSGKYSGGSFEFDCCVGYCEQKSITDWSETDDRLPDSHSCRIFLLVAQTAAAKWMISVSIWKLWQGRGPCSLSPDQICCFFLWVVIQLCCILVYISICMTIPRCCSPVILEFTINGDEPVQLSCENLCLTVVLSCRSSAAVPVSRQFVL